MAGLNAHELLLIVIIVLALFGIGKLPELSRLLSRGMRSGSGAEAEPIATDPEVTDPADIDD